MEDKLNTGSGSPENAPSAASLPQPPMTTSLPLSNMNVGLRWSATTVPAAASASATDTATAAATMTATPGSSGGGEGSKKKRGRPRKYDSDGNLRLTYQQSAPLLPPPTGFPLSPTSPSEFSSRRRARGRATGSGSLPFLASLGGVPATTAGRDFLPHVFTVHTGEDVAGKIFSMAQNGPRVICILSATGAISNVTIRQPGSSGGILTYEGRFEILSLTGSLTVSDNSGIRRAGGLSVSLAGPDGRVIGGGVAGVLTAAGPIQLVVGSFMLNDHKTHKRKRHREHTVASPISVAAETVTAARPISQANPGENFLIPMSQLSEQSQRESGSASSDQQNVDATPNAATWSGSEEFSDQRPSPDINISLPDE